MACSQAVGNDYIYPDEVHTSEAYYRQQCICQIALVTRSKLKYFFVKLVKLLTIVKSWLAFRCTHEICPSTAWNVS